MVEHDPLGLVDGIQPMAYYDLTPEDYASPLDFELTLAPAPAEATPGSRHVLHLVLVGDGGTVLGDTAVTVVVPPS